VGARAGLHAVENRKILPRPGFEPLAVQPVAIKNELSDHDIHVNVIIQESFTHIQNANFRQYENPLLLHQGRICGLKFIADITACHFSSMA
jgi:hypothetical protein